MQKHKLVHFFQKISTLPFVYFSDVRRRKGQQAMTKTVFGYPLHWYWVVSGIGVSKGANFLGAGKKGAILKGARVRRRHQKKATPKKAQ